MEMAEVVAVPVAVALAVADGVKTVPADCTPGYHLRSSVLRVEAKEEEMEEWAAVKADISLEEVLRPTKNTVMPPMVRMRCVSEFTRIRRVEA